MIVLLSQTKLPDSSNPLSDILGAVQLFNFLVDDRTKNGAGLFRGEHIHVGQDPFLDWETVVNYLLPLAKLK
ncbi:Uncharacterised protein [Oligella ureolytica]|nr:Uncharacterised protein [Oligella ureolytica]